jgi:cytochrome P450
MTVIDSYVEIDEILRSRDFRQGSHTESKPFFGDTLLLLDGDAHLGRRRLESRLFRRDALDYYETHALVPVVEQMLAEARQNRAADGTVRADLVPMMRAMLHRISAVVAGIDDVDIAERTERFSSLVEKLGEAATVEWSTRDHADVVREGLDVKQAFLEEFWIASAERRKHLAKEFSAGTVAQEELPRDVLMMMYLNWDDTWDEELPIRECTLFLVASTQTTSHSLPHLFLHLHDWFEEHPEDSEKRTDSEFLRLAAAESLRLHQPVPSLLRFANTDVTLSSGRRIPRGERVALAFTPANRETELFGDDAELFNPYREASDRKRPWGLTFGGGVHLCIGRPLVTGTSTRTDSDAAAGTDGTMVKIARALYESGLELDRDVLPKRNDTSFHDSYSSVPIVLTKL